MSDQRPWLKNYPSGIPVNINVEEYNTLLDFFNDCFAKFRSKPAFYCMGKSLSYDDIDKMSTQFGAYLISRGLKRGDKVALMMPNLLQYPIAVVGCLKAGLIVVNTNPLYTPREMHHQFNDSDVSAILIAENFASNLQSILHETKINTVIVTSIGAMLGGVKKVLTNFVVRKIKKMVPKYDIPNVVTFNEALSAGKKFKIPEFTGSPEDVIVHQYTGGTTGVSKGAMLTNRNLVANMLQIKAWMKPFLKGEELNALSPLPMYHIFAFSANVLAMMSMGVHTILVVNPRDLKTVMKEFKDHKITSMTGVNTLFNGLLNHPDFAALDFSHLAMTVGGGTAVQKAVAERWKAVTGCDLCEGYGMTESSPVATTNPLNGTGRLGTIGVPVPSTDMRIVSEEGDVLAVGEQGEIQIKGPQVMKGYYNRPEATAETIKDGWLCTGDIGLMDEDGFFKIVDRKKDMILVSGFNVYPNEIEDVLAMHPKVMESAAVGVKDDKSGEIVKIFVVKKDDTLTEEELIAHCRENLTGYKIPKLVEFRDDLPKTNVGKILRRELRDK